MHLPFRRRIRKHSFAAPKLRSREPSEGSYTSKRILFLFNIMLLICIDLLGCGVGTGTDRVARQMRFIIFGRGPNSLRHAHCRTWVIQYDFVTHMLKTIFLQDLITIKGIAQHPTIPSGLYQRSLHRVGHEHVTARTGHRLRGYPMNIWPVHQEGTKQRIDR